MPRPTMAYHQDLAAAARRHFKAAEHLNVEGTAAQSEHVPIAGYREFLRARPLSDATTPTTRIFLSSRRYSETP
jgi:hypothetical protein